MIIIDIIEKSEILQEFELLYHENLIYVINNFFQLLMNTYNFEQKDFEFNEDILYVLCFILHNSNYNYYNNYQIEMLLFCIISYCSIDFDMSSSFIYERDYKKKSYFNKNFLYVFDDHSTLIHLISTDNKLFENWKNSWKIYLKK